MKLLSFVCLCSLALVNVAQANTSFATLSQENKHVDIQLNSGDTLAVDYDLSRSPVYRNATWWFYAMYCTASNKAQMEYNIKGESKTSLLPALLTSQADGQVVGADMDAQGRLTIKNASAEAVYIQCDLSNKFGQ